MRQCIRYNLSVTRFARTAKKTWLQRHRVFIFKYMNNTRKLYNIIIILSM